MSDGKRCLLSSTACCDGSSGQISCGQNCHVRDQVRDHVERGACLRRVHGASHSESAADSLVKGDEGRFGELGEGDVAGVIA